MNRAVSRFRQAIRTGIQFVTGGGTPPAETVLRREMDGTVTVLSLAQPYTPILTRQSDGSVVVTVGA